MISGGLGIRFPPYPYNGFSQIVGEDGSAVPIAGRPPFGIEYYSLKEAPSGRSPRGSSAGKGGGKLPPELRSVLRAPLPWALKGLPAFSIGTGCYRGSGTVIHIPQGTY